MLIWVGMTGISRRKLLRNTGAAGAAGTVGASSLFSGCVEDVVGEGGLKIGVLNPYSVIGRWGKISTWGFLSGLASVYGDDPIPLNPDGFWAGERVVYEPEDRRYEMVLRDSTYKPSTAEEGATALVADEEVDVLYGMVDSSSAIRVIEQVAKPTDTIYLTGGTSSPSITANPDYCGRKVFRANEHIGMEARALSKYIGDETDTDEVYLLAVDNTYGRTAAPPYRRYLEANGVEVVGERFVPGGFGEFRAVLEDIDEQANAVVGVFAGRTMQTYLTSLVDGNASGAFDLRAHNVLPGAVGTGFIGGALETALGEVTEEAIESANLGGMVTRYHWNQYDNPMNDDFVSGYEETYGTLPALFACGAFASGSAVAQAVEATGSLDGDDLAEEMYGMTIEKTPKGENAYTFQDYNNQAKSEMTIAEVVPNDRESWDELVMPSEPVARISPDDATIPRDDPDMTCDLTAQ